MLHPPAFRQSTATRLRDRGDRRFGEEDSLPELSDEAVTCGACASIVPMHDAVLEAEGYLCLHCEAGVQTGEALRQESWDAQLSLVGVLGGLVLLSGSVVSLTWMLSKGAWHWTFVAWVAAQMLTLWLGVYGICHGIDDTSVACHDMGLYEALWSLAMFGVLIGLDRMRKTKDGIQVLIFGLAYGPVRFGMDFLRPEATDARYGAFTPAQWGSMVLMAVCVGLIVQRVRAPEAPAKKKSKSDAPADATKASSEG